MHFVDPTLQRRLPFVSVSGLRGLRGGFVAWVGGWADGGGASDTIQVLDFSPQRATLALPSRRMGH